MAKKSKQEATMRNVRAARKRQESLARRVEALAGDVGRRLADLEYRVMRLEEHTRGKRPLDEET